MTTIDAGSVPAQTDPDPFAGFVERTQQLPIEERAAAYRAEATRIADTAARHDRATSDGELSRILACESRAKAAESDLAQRVEQRAALLSGPPKPAVRSPLAVEFTDAQIGELRTAVGNYERRAVTSATAPLDGPMYVPGAVPFYREGTRIADLMRQEMTTAPTVFYPRVTTGATAAAMVAEGGLKPESSPVITRYEAPFRKIAHWLSVSQEAMDDNAGLAAVLRAEGIAGLIERESQQLLTGTGTGQDLLGLVGATGTLTYARAAEARSIALRNAVNVLRTTGAKLPAKHLILHPSTWTKVELEVGSDGQYVNRPSTQLAAVPTLWGLQVVQSTHIGVDDALVADLGVSSVLYVRQAPSIMVDPFTLATSNTIRLVVEERLSHALVEPRAVCRVTGLT